MNGLVDRYTVYAFSWSEVSDTLWGFPEFEIRAMCFPVLYKKKSKKDRIFDFFSFTVFPSGISVIKPPPIHSETLTNLNFLFFYQIGKFMALRWDVFPVHFAYFAFSDWDVAQQECKTRG